MFHLRLSASMLILVATQFLTGCAPIVLCSVQTEVFPDYSCTRVTRMEAYANPRYASQRPRLGEYFQFPPAELYEEYVVQQDKVLFAGMFPSFERIPSDLVRNTPGTNQLAGNLLSFRVMDMVLFVLADFDETLTDIVVSEEDGEAALSELLRLAVPEVMSVLNAKYGTKYDLSRLESWLYNDLPMKLKRVYAGAWAIHSAKRSGVTSLGEEYEFYMFLRAEANREGLELAEIGHPDLEQENLRRLKEYGLRLAQSLVIPRMGAADSQEMLQGVAVDELVASIQKAITARHGSVNNFVSKIAALVPRAFGAYLTGTMMPIYIWPETSYQYRLKVPGTVIQTNGVRDLNGDLVWSFADKDLAFTGQSMWARTIFVREPAVYALGLRGFPASLGDVDRLFGFCLDESGQPREEILKALGQSVVDRNIAPLRALAENTQSSHAASARGIMDLFEKHRQGQAQTVAPQSAPAPIPESPLPAPTPASGPRAQPDTTSEAHVDPKPGIPAIEDGNPFVGLEPPPLPSMH